MTALRRLLRRHHGLAMLVVAAALMLKLLVPAGFMPVAGGDGTITVRICSGMGPTTMAMAMPGANDAGPARGHDGKPVPARADMPCAFSGLAMPMVGGADAVLLAVALAFVLAFGFVASTSVALPAPAHLRPPLRGPPLPA